MTTFSCEIYVAYREIVAHNKDFLPYQTLWRSSTSDVLNSDVRLVRLFE